MAFERGGVVLSGCTGTTVTANASAHTKGASYTELIASSAATADAITVYVHTASVIGQYLLDIAIGGAGTETVLISNLMFHGGIMANSSHAVLKATFPLRIAAGTRISARCQCGTGAATMAVSVMLHGTANWPFQPYQRCTTYGANTATSGGVAVDPGAVANTKTQVEIVASTTFEAKAFLVAMSSAVSAANSMRHLLDIYAGAGAGSQIVQNLGATSQGGSDTSGPCWYGPFYTDVLDGSDRISAYLAANATSTGRIQHVVLYGLDDQLPDDSGPVADPTADGLLVIRKS